MPNPIEILTVEMDGEDGVIVTFSDGSTGAYGRRAVGFEAPPRIHRAILHHSCVVSNRLIDAPGLAAGEVGDITRDARGQKK
jgi:hypothetical protein